MPHPMHTIRVGKALDFEASWQAKIRRLTEIAAKTLLMTRAGHSEVDTPLNRSALRRQVIETVEQAFRLTSLHGEVRTAEIAAPPGAPVVTAEVVTLPGMFFMTFEALDLDRTNPWVQESVMLEVTRELDRLRLTPSPDDDPTTFGRRLTDLLPE